MITTQKREFIQLWREADETGKALIYDMLLCFAYCGEDFIQEIQEAKGNNEAMRSVVTKYVATVKAGVAV